MIKNPPNHMDERSALVHILLLCEQYQSRISWEIVAPVVADSLREDDRISEELHTFLMEKVKSKTIHEFLPYLQAYKARQKALLESFNDLENRRKGARPPLSVFQSKNPKVKGFLKPTK